MILVLQTPCGNWATGATLAEAKKKAANPRSFRVYESEGTMSVDEMGGIHSTAPIVRRADLEPKKKGARCSP